MARAPAGATRFGPDRRDLVALDQHLPARMRLRVHPVEDASGAQKERVGSGGGGKRPTSGCQKRKKTSQSA